MAALFDTMMNDMASPMFDQHLGEAVAITRGANSTENVTASWCAQDEQTDTTNEQHTLHVDRYWFVKKTAYQISGSAVEPRTGDRLTDAAGRIFEVLPAKTIPPVVSYGGGNEWKIATKEVA